VKDEKNETMIQSDVSTLGLINMLENKSVSESIEITVKPAAKALLTQPK
jgi:hypothetical protein